MQKLIMMHGLPLSGKSYNAGKLAEFLNDHGYPCGVTVSNATRDHKPAAEMFSKAWVDETIPETRRQKDISYRRLVDAASAMLDKHSIPIVDATWHKRRRREWVYEVAKHKKASVYILHMLYDDEQGIRKILDMRLSTRRPERNLLDTWDQFMTMKEQFESLGQDEKTKHRMLIKDRISGKVEAPGDDFSKLLKGGLSSW
ncbi:MAG: ATP-binding protein [Nanoarchaeota archaeon]|nr:ATP-binding protein [Nanoarchaeota archaeon]